MTLVVSFITNIPRMLPHYPSSNARANSVCTPLNPAANSNFVPSYWGISSTRVQRAVTLPSHTTLSANVGAVAQSDASLSDSSPSPVLPYVLPPPQRHKQPKRARKGDGAKERVLLRRSGMNSPVVLSGDMRAFCGAEMMLRREVIARIAKYVQEHGLQCGKRTFTCDETLVDLFQCEGTYQFIQINSLLSRMADVRKPSDLGPIYAKRAAGMFREYVKYCNALTQEEYSITMGDKRGLHSKESQLRHMKQNTGMFGLVNIEGKLSELCKGKTRLSRPQLVKAVWAYIKANKLQDEKWRRVVHVDDDFRQALNIEKSILSVDAFEIPGYITERVRATPQLRKP